MSNLDTLTKDFILDDYGIYTMESLEELLHSLKITEEFLLMPYNYYDDQYAHYQAFKLRVEERERSICKSS